MDWVGAPPPPPSDLKLARTSLRLDGSSVCKNGRTAERSLADCGNTTGANGRAPRAANSRRWRRIPGKLGVTIEPTGPSPGMGRQACPAPRAGRMARARPRRRPGEGGRQPGPQPHRSRQVPGPPLLHEGPWSAETDTPSAQWQAGVSPRSSNRRRLPGLPTNENSGGGGEGRGSRRWQAGFAHRRSKGRRAGPGCAGR